MIKASKLFCSIFLALVAASSCLQAQTPADPVQIATDEAIRRQANVIDLHKTLLAAQAARQRNDLEAADKLYEKCYGYVLNIGSGIDAEAAQTRAGLVGVLLDLAKQDQKRTDYTEAELKVNRAIVVDPGNKVAIDFKRQNRQMLENQKGTIPSQGLIERIPSFRTNEVRIATMVRDGKLLYEAGKTDEAEDKLTQVLAEDPGNVPAFQYLQLIKQKKMEAIVAQGEVRENDSMIQVEKGWTRDWKSDEFVVKTNPFARSTLPNTGKGRQDITQKLNNIRLDSVKYDDLPLTEVINNLADLARQRDPDKLGINFFFDRQALPVLAAAANFDPSLAAAPALTDQPDASSVTVKISPGLSNVRLADVLDAITKTAKPAVKFSILDYAVMFSLRGQESAALETRSFHVDPNTFVQGLQGVQGISFGGGGSTGGGGGGGGGGIGGGSSSSSSSSGGGTGTIVPQVSVTGISISGGGGGGGIGGGGGGIGGGGAGGIGGGGAGGIGGGGGGGGGGLRFVTVTNAVASVQALARQFIASIGVDLATNNPANAGKVVVFNDRAGILLVRATSQDLDLIEAAMQTLNHAPPEINIKAKFIEITQNDVKGLGFNWDIGGFKIGQGVVAQGGTQPSLNGTPTSVNPGGIFPTSDTAAALSDGNLTSGLRNTFGPQLAGTLPTVATITGILTEPQFRATIQALDQRDGTDELNATEVTTESGRQAQMQAVDIVTIVTGTTTTTGTGAGTPTPAGTGTIIATAAAPAVNYPTSTYPLGPTLDVIPYVSADEYSVQMTLIPTVTEFVGYDNPGQFVPEAVAAGSGGANLSVTATLPLPHFRAREVVTSVSVWDSQTVVLGGLISDVVTKVKDQVPMLGTLPLIGRLFQSQSSSKTKKNLMIFVTPTIINPDGTRYHSDDEMPFNQAFAPVAKPMSTP